MCVWWVLEVISQFIPRPHGATWTLDGDKQDGSREILLHSESLQSSERGTAGGRGRSAAGRCRSAAGRCRNPAGDAKMDLRAVSLHRHTSRRCGLHYLLPEQKLQPAPRALQRGVQEQLVEFSFKIDAHQLRSSLFLSGSASNFESMKWQ